MKKQLPIIFYVNDTSTQLASYNWYADGSKYSAERSDGTGYVYKGNVIYEKAAGGALSLDCVLTTGGRIVANKNSSGTITGYTVYHHITDHLGSVRAITNASTGTVVETSDFLPFGTRWSQTSGSSSATITDATNRWRYSGKEEQKAINSTLPLIDYGARMYDPTIARWMSMDPMAEKYYPMSPYGYCAGNPINILDPNGSDVWEIDELGRVRNRIENTTTDSFYMVSVAKDGTYQRTGQSISFEYGTVIKNTSQFSDENKVVFDWYSVRGDTNSNQLFEFLASNTKVEWSQLSMGVKGDNGLNVLSTSHLHSKDYSMNFLIKNKYQYGYTIRSHTHSHPQNRPYPSGLKDNSGDMGFASWLNNLATAQGHNLPKYRIYLPTNGSYITYDANSIASDFLLDDPFEISPSTVKAFP